MSQIPPNLPSSPPARKRLHPLVQAIAGILFAGVLILVFGGHDDSPAATTVSNDAEPATAATPADQHTMKDTYFGCLTPSEFKDAESYQFNGEKALLKGLFDSGSCEMLRKGEVVIITDVKFLDYVVVRRPNDATKLITSGDVMN